VTVPCATSPAPDCVLCDRVQGDGSACPRRTRLSGQRRTRHGGRIFSGRGDDALCRVVDEVVDVIGHVSDRFVFFSAEINGSSRPTTTIGARRQTLRASLAVGDDETTTPACARSGAGTAARCRGCVDVSDTVWSTTGKLPARQAATRRACKARPSSPSSANHRYQDQPPADSSDDASQQAAPWPPAGNMLSTASTGWLRCRRASCTQAGRDRFGCLGLTKNDSTRGLRSTHPSAMRYRALTDADDGTDSGRSTGAGRGRCPGVRFTCASGDNGDRPPSAAPGFEPARLAPRPGPELGPMPPGLPGGVEPVPIGVVDLVQREHALSALVKPMLSTS